MLNNQLLRIATRKSPMALWQANHIKQQIQTVHPGVKIELVELLTQGDKETNVPLTNLGGKALFVKELQRALLQNQADLAVHCVKDMSVQPCPGLTLYAVCEREDPRDVLVSSHYHNLHDLPKNATIGTSSPRRECLLKNLRPDLNMQLLRGNVNTRLRKLIDDEYDALILTAAGLDRLRETRLIREYFPTDVFIPAIGQGALGVECRENDDAVQTLIKHLDHPPTHLCINAERAVNQKIGGDCHTPLGAHAHIVADQLHIHAMIGYCDGSELLRRSIRGNPNDAQQLGWQLGEDLLVNGAKKYMGSVEDCL